MTSSSSPSLPTESTTPSMPYYKPILSPRLLNHEVRAFFETYVGIAPAEVEKHVLGVPLSAPSSSSSPFTPPTEQTDPSERQTNPNRALFMGNATFVDLGCCLGTEMRWLAADGVPTTHMIGVDIMREFWELGFELYQDGDRGEGRRMQARFIQGDIFDSSADDNAHPEGFEADSKKVAEGGLAWSEEDSLASLNDNVDVLFAGYFFHLFPLSHQLLALTRVVRWSRGPGSVVCGVLIGSRRPKDPPQSSTTQTEAEESNSHRPFYHNETSLLQLWQSVSRTTGTEWKVDIQGQRVWDEEGGEGRWMGEEAVRIRFVGVRAG
ncbi:MAG: hypothetical protein M1827_004629 [Pycnora praestabilis]|nr:MAG: hypothetical protein M1827_004629 [Pycnora praestabilis]